MLESQEDKSRWYKKQLHAAGEQIQIGSQALRQGRNTHGVEALSEAEAILDMAEVEDEEALKLRARVFNELGVAHQRSNQLEKSRHYHREAAAICNQLLEKGVDFEVNSAATYLNLSSIHLALGDVDAAQQCGEGALEFLEGLEDDAAQEGKRGTDPLELGALQNLAVIYGRQKRWEKTNEVMERACQVAEGLAEGEQKNFLAQLAQGCQQLSVMLFEAEEFDDALKWGRKAAELSERAYEAIGRQVLPVYIISQLNLISYYEKRSAFADAEDCLWKALDVAGNDPRILHRGVIFYETCRKQADPRLEEGNLPREEVDAGYDELMIRVEAAGGIEAVREQEKQMRTTRR